MREPEDHRRRVTHGDRVDPREVGRDRGANDRVGKYSIGIAHVLGGDRDAVMPTGAWIDVKGDR
jgi:hypothetical protein